MSDSNTEAHAPDSDTESGAPHHYIQCDYCDPSLAGWDVIVGPHGEIRSVECKKCGGTGWEEGQEAHHV